MWFIEEYTYRTATEEEVWPGGQGTFLDYTWGKLCDQADEKRLRETGWVRVTPGYPTQQAAYQEVERRYAATAATAATYTMEARQRSSSWRAEVDPTNLMCRIKSLPFHQYDFHEPEKLLQEKRWRVRC